MKLLIKSDFLPKLNVEKLEQSMHTNYYTTPTYVHRQQWYGFEYFFVQFQETDLYNIVFSKLKTVPRKNNTHNLSNCLQIPLNTDKTQDYNLLMYANQTFEWTKHTNASTLLNIRLCAVPSQSPKRKLAKHMNMDVIIFASGFNVDQSIRKE